MKLTFVYQGDGYDVAITVAKATVRMGAQRTAMLATSTIPEEAADTIVQRVWINVVSATVEVKNAEGAEKIVPWPLDLDDFAELPEPLGVKWENEVHDLNAHWVPWRERESKPGESNGDVPDNSET